MDFMLFFLVKVVIFCLRWLLERRWGRRVSCFNVVLFVLELLLIRLLESVGLGLKMLLIRFKNLIKE